MKDSKTCPSVNVVLQRDPSRTTMLRRQFVREMEKRFRLLKRDIAVSIVDRDCFDIQPDVLRVLIPTPTKAFAFERTEDKVKSFMKWLEEQEEKGVLEIIYRPETYRGVAESPWTNVYVDSAYSKGMRRARTELRRKGYSVPTFDQTMGGIRAAMNQPHHAERIGMIYSRTYEDLKTVVQAANGQMRRKIADGLTTGLARGLLEGKNPKTIARELVKDVKDRVDKIGLVRARTIARSEVIRAHHVATIAEYERADAEMDVTVQAEWATAGFEVCPICADLAARGPYKLKAIEGMIPAHPNCRCCALPLIEEPRRKR